MEVEQVTCTLFVLVTVISKFIHRPQIDDSEKASIAFFRVITRTLYLIILPSGCTRTVQYIFSHTPGWEIIRTKSIGKAMGSLQLRRITPPIESNYV